MHGLFSNSWRRLEAQAVCSTEERIPPAGRLPTLHNSQLWQLDFLCASWILEAPCAGFSQIQAMSIPEKKTFWKGKVVFFHLLGKTFISGFGNLLEPLCRFRNLIPLTEIFFKPTCQSLIFPL